MKITTFLLFLTIAGLGFFFVQVNQRLIVSADDTSDLLANSSFEDGTLTSPEKEIGNPVSWHTAEGVANPGTGKIVTPDPTMVSVLCGKKAPIKALDGKCLLKIHTDLYKKATSVQTYRPLVIDKTFTQTVGLYIPNIPDNNQYLQQIELREGTFPGAAGQILQVRYKNDKLSICPSNPPDVCTNSCKDFSPLKKDIWYKLKITFTQKGDPESLVKNAWDLRVEDLISGKVWWDSQSGKGTPTYLRDIKRERITAQIASLFIGDECQTGPGVNSCDGVGTIYYDQLEATNPEGAGRTNYIIPGDANNDGQINDADFDILKANYLPFVTGSAASSNQGMTNDEGDFFNDGVLDGKDFSVWFARSGLN